MDSNDKPANLKFAFCCRQDNDLFRVVSECLGSFDRYDTPEGAVAAAEPGSGVLLLADDYPRAAPAVEQSLVEQAASKNLRLYTEYPISVADLELGQPQATEWERLVVCSDFFGPELKELSILAAHGCWYLPVTADNPHLAVARVAGFDKAVFGLPEEAKPVLLQLPDSDVLIATTKLSQFVTGRYGPGSSWASVWQGILSWLSRSDQVPQLRWRPTVRPSHDAQEQLPDSAGREAFCRSIEWFSKSNVVFKNYKKSFGVAEALASGIDHQGRQQLSQVWRADCSAETAMVYAFDWAMDRNPASRRTAERILDTTWATFQHAKPEEAWYGLVDWYYHNTNFYGDDNARVILSSLAACRLLDEDRWLEPTLRCLLANLRTTGPDGYRRRNIKPRQFANQREGWPEMKEKGWRYFYNNTIEMDPSGHFQGYLWACYLWAYALTGWDGFVSRTVKAIEHTMSLYPDKWEWVESMTEELARMLLPLAYLIRAQDQPRHRAWLKQVTEDLLKLTRPCGAIAEMFGDLQYSTFPPPKSNREYGTAEQPVIQQNGDPACDLLYSLGFAYLGLHEVAGISSDPKIKQAEDKLGDFLCRVQVRSQDHKNLDGAWIRAFDYRRWEYWGCSGDIEYGAWMGATGWTNSWICSVFAMRHLGQTFFDLSLAKKVRALLPRLLDEMDLA